MARRKPGFNAAQKHYVKKAFTFNGRKFNKAGVLFPWRRLGCSLRALRSMYECGKLYYKDQDEELVDSIDLQEDVDLDEVSTPVDNPDQNDSEDESDDSDDESDDKEQEDEPEDESDDSDDESDESSEDEVDEEVVKDEEPKKVRKTARKLTNRRKSGK